MLTTLPQLQMIAMGPDVWDANVFCNSMQQADGETSAVKFGVDANSSQAKHANESSARRATFAHAASEKKFSFSTGPVGTQQNGVIWAHGTCELDRFEMPILQVQFNVCRGAFLGIQSSYYPWSLEGALAAEFAPKLRHTNAYL